MTIYHTHHIIPRHMGGTDEPENLVKVTVKEHARLHKQLWEDLGYEEDRIAWLCLSGQITTAEANILATKAANTGRSPWNKGLKGVSGRPSSYRFTDEQKRLISERTKEGMRKTKKKLGAPKGTIPWNKGNKKGEQ